MMTFSSQDPMGCRKNCARPAVSAARLRPRGFGRFITATFSFLLLNTACADLYRTSQMVGFATGNLGVAGANEGWVGGNANITVTNGSGSLNGAALGLAASAGDMASLSATDALPTYNLFATSGQFPASGARNLYFSFLYRFNSAADVSVTGERLIQVNRQNSGSAYSFQVLARETAGQLQFGVTKTNGTPVFATTNINVGDAAFVIVRWQMIVGAADDIVDLWVNPPANAFGADESNLPAPDASTFDGAEDTSNTGPGRFYVASGANAEFDELRIASTWAEVTPSAAACDPATVTLDPVDQTVVAGLPAKFSVTASGTAPTFQWQISTNSGDTWNNVSGGTGAASPGYSTPNLTLGDNGNRYRAIVSVACGGGSSATSQVAIVTVGAPVLTPVGRVVEDVWSDLVRNDPPVTSSNSVWLGQGLDAGSGALVGTTAPGSSRLWLGFFTDDSTPPVLPVHLDVGRAIRTTLVFTPENVVANGGNSMRIGMFDYADGGTRPTGDPGGSAGNGQNVRGYMLGLNFGTSFSDDTPLEIFARNNLSDGNLMGSGGLYQSLGQGPAGLAGAPAFISGTEYSLEFSVARTAASAVDITITITGGGASWSHTVTDGTFAYHRFDAFALRPGSQETTADTFTFTRFLAEVIEAALPFEIAAIERLASDSVKLTWESISNRVYQVQSRETLDSGGWVTNATVTATGSFASFTNAGLSSIPQRYYRVVNTP